MSGRGDVKDATRAVRARVGTAAMASLIVLSCIEMLTLGALLVNLRTRPSVPSRGDGAA